MREKLEKGLPIPGAVQRIVSGRVILFPWLESEWNAFWVLSPRRKSGWGGPEWIELSEIAAYAAMQGYTPGEDLDDLIFGVGILDAEWLVMCQEEVKRKEKGKGKGDGTHGTAHSDRSDRG
jgi:hypothetical protein